MKHGKFAEEEKCANFDLLFTRTNGSCFSVALHFWQVHHLTVKVKKGELLNLFGLGSFCSTECRAKANPKPRKIQVWKFDEFWAPRFVANLSGWGFWPLGLRILVLFLKPQPPGVGSGSGHLQTKQREYWPSIPSGGMLCTSPAVMFAVSSALSEHQCLLFEPLPTPCLKNPNLSPHSTSSRSPMGVGSWAARVYCN